MDYQLSQMCEQVMAARANFRPIEIVGGGTKRFYGNPSVSHEQTLSLQMMSLSGVLGYEPSELVITALAGTPLTQITATLEAQGQMLAFDPPAFGPSSTIGGVVASGLSGPLSFGYGPLRHYVLGLHLLDAQGRVLKFGGEVMKNVAGYDVSRLIAGSLGTFGVIVQVSMKVIPKPTLDQTQVFMMSEAQALAWCHGLRAKPLPVKAAAWLAQPDHEDSGQLAVRLCGAESAVKQAQKELGGETMPEESARTWWRGFRDQTHAFFQARPLWRVAVRAGTGPLALGPSAFDLGGEIRWVSAAVSPEHIRQVAQRADGHATLFRWVDVDCLPSDGVFQPMQPAATSIVRRLKQEFDPKAIFNAGRLLAGL